MEARPSLARRLVALDIGTGSGAIALSLLKEGPFERVVATDLSQGALEVAQGNAARLGLADRLELRAGGLWQALPADATFDVVASNPPYVAESERSQLAPEVREWEPAGALFAGAAGFDVLGPLIAGAAPHLRPGGLLALEIGASQAERTLALLDATGAYQACRVARDLAGRQRVVLATRRGVQGEAGAGEEEGERVGESLAQEAERREHA
ncbi:MAG TPA: HemK family protein methyltransferase [Longimicrobiales bacterium]